MSSKYLDVVEEIASRGEGVSPGSPEESSGLAAFESFFGNLDEVRIREMVRDVYAEDVFFNDTLKEIRGTDALEHYLVESARETKSCRVRVDDVASHAGHYYVRWVMDIEFKKLKPDETHRSIGISHLRFDRRGKIVLHQDYWDSASGLFEHIPVLGYGIRKIRGRL